MNKTTLHWDSVKKSCSIVLDSNKENDAWNVTHTRRDLPFIPGVKPTLSCPNRVVATSSSSSSSPPLMSTSCLVTFGSLLGSERRPVVGVVFALDCGVVDRLPIFSTLCDSVTGVTSLLPEQFKNTDSMKIIMQRNIWDYFDMSTHFIILDPQKHKNLERTIITILLRQNANVKACQQLRVPNISPGKVHKQHSNWTGNFKQQITCLVVLTK